MCALSLCDEIKKNVKSEYDYNIHVGECSARKRKENNQNKKIGRQCSNVLWRRRGFYSEPPLSRDRQKKIIYTWNNTFVHTLLSRIYLSVFIVGRLHWKRLLFSHVPHKVSEVPPAISLLYGCELLLSSFGQKRNKVTIARPSIRVPVYPRKKGRIYHFFLFAILIITLERWRPISRGFSHGLNI